MPGPIFIHVQTFSRKANPAGQSVAQVIGEGLREPEFSDHVEAPQEPRVLFGDPGRMQGIHDEHVAARATEVRTKKGVRSRAIRQDRHTLATVVASYPLTHAQIEAGGDQARAHHARWEAATLDWLRAEYGDQLRVAVAHDDEEHPHLHVWLLPNDPGADATTLHPGKVAKRQIEAEAKAAGEEPRDAVRAGNRALRAEMRGWIDRYHQDVGVPLGMTRDGPRRRRLSRADWQAEKEAAARHAEMIAYAKQIEGRAADQQHIERQQMSVMQMMDRRADQLDAEEEHMALERAELDRRATKLAKLATSISRMIETIADKLGVRRDLDAIEEEITRLDADQLSPDR